MGGLGEQEILVLTPVFVTWTDFYLHLSEVMNLVNDFQQTGVQKLKFLNVFVYFKTKWSFLFPLAYSLCGKAILLLLANAEYITGFTGIVLPKKKLELTPEQIIPNAVASYLEIRYQFQFKETNWTTNFPMMLFSQVYNLIFYIHYNIWLEVSHMVGSVSQKSNGYSSLTSYPSCPDILIIF